MKAVILAGGEGTRLRPITFLNPKPMLPLANRPFMENFVLWLRSHDIKDIIFSAGYLSEVFKDYFGDGRKFGLKITFVEEDRPLGTCGGVKNVEKYLGSESFLVFNGDILSSLNLARLVAFHKKKKADVTISVTGTDDPSSYGLVPVDGEGRITGFLEKPKEDEIVTDLVNAGIYVMEPGVLKNVPAGEKYSFERQLFPALLEKGHRIFGYVFDSYWLDVGTPQKYLMANRDVLHKKIVFKFPCSEVMKGIYAGTGTGYSKSNFVSGPVIIGNGTKIEKNAKIMPLTVIGDNCSVSEGTEISESVIFNNCKIGKKCNIKRAIISNNVVIGDNVTIEDYSVIGDNSIIGKNNILKKGIKININSNVSEDSINF
ncbi:MAG: NDP-sugar synthase [Actinomycetota bacterium]|nr:NDP-sugar synthase [Actinomycetota bacterium]